MMKFRSLILCVCLFAALGFTYAPDYTPASPLKFSISFTKEMSDQAQDGRLLLMLANNNKSEPRFQVGEGLKAQLVFGIDVDGMKPGQEMIIDEKASGFPIVSLNEIPAGDYYVQALINRYETFKLKTGHTVKLPPDKGEGQHWNSKPGNFYSKPIKITLDPKKPSVTKVVMDQVIPAVDEPKDTKYIKHIKIQSQLLTEFWGKPMYLGAWVLLPEGFDEHPEARYPLMVNHGHFPSDFGGFSTEPPPANMDTTKYNERFRIYGYEKIEAQ